MSEQFGKTVSHAKPVVDSVLPDGLELTLYLEKTSVKGTNATIRKFAKYSTFNYPSINIKNLDLEAAYMWMMLNEGMVYSLTEKLHLVKQPL